MKAITVQDTNTGDYTVLPAVPGKIYIIHGWRVYGVNTAGTACNVILLKHTDFWTGLSVQDDTVLLVPNTASNGQDIISGLNIPTYPGTPIILNSDAAPAVKLCTLYYTEVSI